MSQKRERWQLVLLRKENPVAAGVLALRQSGRFGRAKWSERRRALIVRVSGSVRGGEGGESRLSAANRHLTSSSRDGSRSKTRDRPPCHLNGGPRVSDTDYSYLHIICLDTQSDKSLKHVSGVGGGEATIFIIPTSLSLERAPISLLFLDNLKKLYLTGLHEM